MEDPINFQEIERRAQRALYEDGLMEIILGIYLVVFAVVIRGSPSFVVFLVFLSPVMMGLAKKVKERYVYPRMGYAEYANDVTAPDPRIIYGLIVVLIGLFGSFFVLVWWVGELGWNLWFRWIAPISFGGLFGLGPLIAVIKFRIKRYYVFSALPMILGIIISFMLPVPDPGYSSLYTVLSLELAVLGGLAFVVGTILFLRFIRRYPVPLEISMEETQ
jgi:hypothetical protein